MSSKDEIREFLISRRAHLTPAAAGIPDTGGDRRVPGLRREEVAALAGLSPDYYTRLERGAILGASESVLGSIARALQLTDVERAHLFDLAHEQPLLPSHRTDAPTRTVRASVQRVLDNMHVPAVVYNTHQDLVASNMLGRALFAPLFDVDHPNMATFIFLDSRAPHFYEDWALACSLTAAMLRFEAGRDPLNPELTTLIGELSTRSPQFRQNWAERDVHEHRTGRKIYRHPAIGDLDLTYDVFEMPGEPGLSIGTYTADTGSPSADNLALLATWAASHDPDSTTNSHDPDSTTN
ncbi:helix-turn-helix domain-containing protein [Rathayibacter sp. VKM Ac-2835]|uniref:helix-turn-helix transcriptional regulator n=1 Tax=Rathayibacter sp. VKM Ac-2835 TaxID=2739043 RepID=UPI0015656241|nr:helix-turn-helix transcriptional regulator [Rathayibacter sp. VKM Ac-2835]NRG42631.1 helix-turn-helix domain-containing protein [Rathayibacter sp. VKM Ac-2835]